MSLKERIYSVLVVSGTERSTAALTAFLPESSYGPVTAAASVSAARRALSQCAFDFILINSPLPDDPGIRFAVDSCLRGSSVVLLLAAADLCGQISDQAIQRGVYLLPKPFPRGSMLQALRWMAATRERLRAYEEKVRPIEEKMAEIRLVDRAKWLLINELKMSEPDAHYYITHRAMDRCVSKLTIAEEIIRSYP